MEAEGLGPRDIIREVKALLTADPSKVLESDGEGGFRLKAKLLPKHMRAVVEVSKSRVKFIDRVAALRLAAEMAKQIGRSQQAPQQPAQLGPGVSVKQAIFMLPGTGVHSNPPAIQGVADVGGDDD